MDWREVQRLAEKGCLLEDIMGSLEVEPEVLEAHRERLERTVTKGNALYRLELFKRLYREAVGKGRVTALLASARAYLPIYAEALGEPMPAEAGVLRQLEGILDRLQSRKRGAVR